MDYTAFIKDLEEFMPTLGSIFDKCYNSLLAGEPLPGLDEIWNMILNTVKENMADSLQVFFSMFIIGLLSSVLTHCGNIFKNRQISDLAFYFTYLYAVILLLQVFYVMLETAVAAVESIISFTQILIPAFYITVAMCYASITAGAFYQLNLLLLYAVEIIFPEVIIPLISCFVFIAVISGSAEEDRFHEILSLIKKSIGVIIKVCMSTVAGIGVMKSLIHPVADHVNYNLFQKTIAAIPGIGDVTDSVSKMLLGSAVLIKNSMGIVALLLMILLVSAPLTKLFLLSFLLKAAGAGVGLFGEQRLTKCIARVSEGGFMLLKATLAVIMIFFILIALVTAVAGRGY